MPNLFDQFDQLTGNIFDQFDGPQAVPGITGAPGLLDTFNDATTGATQGLTFGLSDELMAGLATPFRVAGRAVTGSDEGKGVGERFSDAFDTELAQQRSLLNAAQERSPIATTAGEVAGGLATGGTLAKGGATLLNVAKPTVPRMAAAAAGEGALFGGAFGFGTGEGTDDRLMGAATGAGLGAAFGGALGAASGVAAQRAARNSIPGVEQWRAAKRSAYQAVDDLDARYAQPSFGRLIDRIKGAAASKNLNPRRHPKAASMIDDLELLRGRSPSLTELDQMRQVIRRDVANASDDAEAFFGDQMISAIDDYIAKAGPVDMVSMRGADAAKQAITKARNANATFRKAETIEDALKRAARGAARSGSGGNIDNKIRQEIDAILRSPKKSRFFNQEEKQAMDKVVRGGNMQNFARWLGKLSPEGNGLSLLLQIISGVATQGATVPIAVGGFAAKRIADKATPRNVDVLSQLIRSQGRTPAPSVSARNRALVDALLKGGATQTGEIPR